MRAWEAPRRAAVAAIAAAIVAAAAAGGPQPAAGRSGPEVTRSERITREDDTPTRTYSSPAMAFDPEDEDVAVAAFAEMRTGRCSLVRSRDGGRTWQRAPEPPALPSYPLCFTPSSSNVPHAQVAFGRDHALYVAMAGWDAQDGLRTSVLLARSDDLGDTWTRTLVRDVRGQPEPEAENTRPVASLVVDRSGPEDVVHVAWTRRLVNARPVRPGVPVVATSTDGGRTFSEPVSVIGGYFAEEANWRRLLEQQPAAVLPGTVRTPPADITGERFGGFEPKLVLGRHGAIFVLWTHQTVGINPYVPSSLFLSVSPDGGKTFTVVDQVVPPTGAFGNPMVAWTPVGGDQGTIHLVHEDKAPLAQGDRDVVYRRSTDGGRTWTPPRIVHDDDPARLNAQFLPNVVATADGRVDVAWWDFRHDTGAFLNDAYLASSPDNGTTWRPNIRVTDRSIDRKIGPWSNGYDVRQPPGMAATDGYTLVAWDDTRHGDPDGQAQDLYRAFVQFEALPAATSPSLVYLFAAVVGLMLAGLVVSGVGVANRRRRRRPPTSEAARSPEPAGVR